MSADRLGGPEIPADREVDLLCVGGDVLGAGRSDVVGGVAACSGGFVWVGGAPRLAPRASSDDTLDATGHYLDHVQGDRAVDRAARADYLHDARKATAWFREAGVPLQVIPNAPDLYHLASRSTAEGRLLECVLDGRDLGRWRDRLAGGRPGPLNVPSE